VLDAYLKVSGLEKTARIWSRPLGVCSEAIPSTAGEDHWLKKFEGTPFLKKAKALEVSAAGDRTQDAALRVRRAEERLEDAKFETKIASLEQSLTDWTHSQEGKEKSAFAEKLAECRYRSFKEWSDYFKGSPFYKTAMALEVDDARREIDRRKRSMADSERWRKDDQISIKRAELDADLAGWRLEQMGFSKTAAANLVSSKTLGALGGGLALGGVATLAYRRLKKDFGNNAKPKIKTSEDHTMSLPQHTVDAFFSELEEIEKIARAQAGRGALAAMGGLGVVGTAGGTYTGHKKGRRTGQQEGMRAGYMAGARRGFQAGQRHTIHQLRARMAQAQSAASRTKSKK